MTDPADTSGIQPTEEHKPASAEPMSLLSVSAGSLNVGSGPRQAEHQMPILAAAAEEYEGIIYWIIIDSVVVYEDKPLAATFDLVTSSAKPAMIMPLTRRFDQVITDCEATRTT